MNYPINNSNINDEIDFRQIFILCSKHKRKIFLFSILGLLFSGLLAINKKKVWQGEFQIVLENKQDERISKFASEIPILTRDTKDPLRTEVEILKSPSVLMDTFQFIKSAKELTNESGIKNLRFKKWRKDSLNIALTSKTAVLNIIYEDTDKDLILPALEKISLAYQNYSGQKRLNNLNQAEEYLSNQINLFKKKSLESIRLAQQFAIDNDLTVLNFAEMDKEIPNSININQIRIINSSKIKDIDFQISQLANLDNDPNKLLYFGRFIEGLQETGLPDELRSIEEDLSFKRLVFKDEDETIKLLIQRRDIIIPIFKKQALNILESEKIAAQNRLKLAERPKGTITNYNQLLSKAKKDKITLDNIEDQYRAILLEKAKSNDPWSLITNPTLYPGPVRPIIKFYLFFGLFAGLFFGIIVSIILDKKRDQIINEDEYEKLSNSKILINLSERDTQTWEESLKFIAKSFIKKNSGKTLLFFNEKLDNYYLEIIKKNIASSLEKSEYKFSSNISDLSDCNSIILITILGHTKREKFKDLIKNISILELPILGIVILDKIKEID